MEGRDRLGSGLMEFLGQLSVHCSTNSEGEEKELINVPKYGHSQ